MDRSDNYGANFEPGCHVKTETDVGLDSNLDCLLETGECDQGLSKTEYSNQDNSVVPDDCHVLSGLERTEMEPGPEKDMYSVDAILVSDISCGLQIKREPNEIVTPVSNGFYWSEHQVTQISHPVEQDSTLMMLEPQELEYRDPCVTDDINMKNELVLKADHDSVYQVESSGETYIQNEVAPDNSQVPLSDIGAVGAAQIGQDLMEQEPGDESSPGADELLKIEVEDPLHPSHPLPGARQDMRQQDFQDTIGDELQSVPLDLSRPDLDSTSDRREGHNIRYPAIQPCQNQSMPSVNQSATVLSRHSGLASWQGTHLGERSCGQLDETFTQNNNLIGHIHTEEGPFKGGHVDHSPKVFEWNGHFVEQQHVHSGDKQFQCDQCDKTFSQRSNLISHIRVHTGERPFKCDCCDKAFKANGDLVVHKRIHTGERPFECDQCLKTFTQLGHLVMHKCPREGEKKFECDQCDETFRTRGDLSVHKRNHTGKKEFKCDQCPKVFTRNGHLVAHRRVHTGDKPFECDQCDKTFSQRNNLVSHKRVHTGERPFQCDRCDKAFKVSGDLLVHKRIHTGERQFECNECDKTFSRKSHLICHKRVHTGERPFQCDQCDKAFKTSGDLLVHKRIHTGVKPFKCDQCDMAYNRSISLVRHQHSHTEEIPLNCD